jgi:DNA polymerase-3 subunit delta'
MWQRLLQHDDIVDRFRTTLRRGRLASTYLFVGPEGIGKRRFALALAKALLCRASADESLEPCNACESCRLFDAGNHPDLDLVSLPPDKSTLPLALFIGDDEHRNQEGLCHRIALRPFLGGRKIAIIDDADHFSAESANCLLKTLEEPPPKSLLILVGTSPSKQLPTIRSRSQVVRFHPLSEQHVAEILLQNETAADAAQAQQLAAHSGGSVTRALAIAEPALWEFREQLLRDLTTGPANSMRTARAIQAFVDDAGKEASDRRERLRTVIGFAEDFYRGLLRTGVGAPTDGDDRLLNAIGTRATYERGDSAHRVLAALDGCLATEESVDRNANLALVIQRWCEDLSESQVSK